MQILLPAKFLKDMARLPVLVAHYFQHSHTGRHIHFTDFIADHYSDHDHTNKDHNNHKNLPFHDHDFDFHQNIFTVAVLDIFPTVLTNFGVVDLKTKIISRQHFHSSTALSSIWRPPKTA